MECSLKKRVYRIKPELNFFIWCQIPYLVWSSQNITHLINFRLILSLLQEKHSFFNSGFHIHSFIFLCIMCVVLRTIICSTEYGLLDFEQILDFTGFSVVSEKKISFNFLDITSYPRPPPFTFSRTLPLNDKMLRNPSNRISKHTWQK